MQPSKLLIASLLSAGAVGAAAAAPADAYRPLQLYAGAWKVAMSNGKTMRVDNHCARTGRFFVCEQVVDGSPENLVVFLPIATRGEELVYRTQAIGADGKGPKGASTLTITGERWVYASEPPVSGGERERTVNLFSGPDHIHFDIQSAPDGTSWKTSLSGDEVRVR